MRPTRRLAVAVLLVAATATPLLSGQAATRPTGDRQDVRPAELAAAQPLAAQVTVAVPTSGVVRPGTAVQVSGRLGRTVAEGDGLRVRPVAGTYSLQVRLPDGRLRGPYGPFATGARGELSARLPAAATRGVRPGLTPLHDRVASVEVVDVRAGGRQVARAGAAALPLAVSSPSGLVLENSFVSSVGWVKPGDTYPSRVIVSNPTTGPVTGATVTVAAAPGMRFLDARVTGGGGSAVTTADTVTWTVGNVPARTDAGPGLATLVLEARADNLEEDPEVVWKDLSTAATLKVADDAVTDRSAGPKVIPPDEVYSTARYGDRPFPVVPAEYYDRAHATAGSAAKLDEVINSPDIPGSTFNLFQEISYRQLFPNGTVPSSGVATADFDVEFRNPRYADGFRFTQLQPGNTCTGATLGDTPELVGSPAYSERIVDGWYRLPGTTNYYGQDGNGSGIPGALTGVAPLFQIDNACGPTGKAVYDAAHIADPEIDYNDYDTDKDGVVDFFMMVFTGLGGNGVSQGLACDPAESGVEECPVPPYDNIWPHSSSLETQYTDEETGLTGYISDDQLEDLEGRPLYYTNDTYTQMTTTVTDFPVYVRVGPYNVNPESAIDRASVISHEYGHSLGLPDFYSSGDRETYGDWNLMATDKSQNMDVFSRQDLGWVVPRVLTRDRTVTGWRDGKIDTHRIDWQTPAGEPYTLSGPRVHNGEAYTVKLPSRRVIDPAKVAASASPTKLWWSRSGSDFNCSPEKGHNLDIALPDLADVPAGTPVTLTFKSYWDIEWDYDYGFVLVGSRDADGDLTYSSVPSENGYTTPGQVNPNQNQCQARYGNGITGTSASYAAGTAPVDRLRGEYDESGPFLADSYDISALAGKGGVVRFTYATDPAFVRPGWFIDDLKVTAGDRVVYQTDFDDGGPTAPRIFNGGCKQGVSTADRCTPGWAYIDSSLGSSADHGYYLEMRDRSGFDFDGKGQNDREPIGFQPGMLLVYTNETEGYGNTGESTEDPPNQHPLDAKPQPGEIAPELDDAAYNPGERFDDRTHVDNYVDEESESGNWEFRFSCLALGVERMSGQGVGPNTGVGVGGDLVGDVRVDLGRRCAAFNYGYGTLPPNTAPTALAQARPRAAGVGEEILFDGSRSYDDRQAASGLRYAWDFESDGTVDARGQTVRHAYAKPGEYTATLRVTDRNGAADTAELEVVVRGAGPGGGGGSIPTTGAPAALPVAALALLVGGLAMVGMRRRRTG